MEWGEDAAGATPITEAQREGLKLTWIATRADLNDAEADNILRGADRWRRKRLYLSRLLDDKALRDLHRDLFGEVWEWAGSYRTRELNIGIDYRRIYTALRDLTEDAKFWFAAGADMPVDEAATRFHHRLVEIHPFLNGNGRHAREITDLLLTAADREVFTWGGRSLDNAGETRAKYMSALRAADHGDFDFLFAFVRS